MKQLIFIIFTFCVISNTYAQMDCESIPSCAEMGYTQDSCGGGKGVRCPFDENKFYCAGVKQLPDAPEPVITPEDWTAECADKIDHCTAYNTECQCTACEEKYLLADNICIQECVKADHVCLVWDYDICKCTKCPDGYEPNEYGICVARTVCDTTKVEHCATYTSSYEPCSCKTCETNYLLDGGVCKKVCTTIPNCSNSDAAYDSNCNCTSCKSGFHNKNGFCLWLHNCDKCKFTYPFFAGRENTQAAVNQIGNKALAAYAATQFYVGDKNGDFGQGKWHLPSIGEWAFFYNVYVTGTKYLGNVSGYINATGDNMVLINNALNILNKKGVQASALDANYYWSSSERTVSNADYIYYDSQSGKNYESYYYKYGDKYHVRCSMFVTLSTGGIPPKVGDVMYSDKTYSSASDYDGSKTPVGVISSISEDEDEVTIINLKDLTFSSSNKAGNFDPDNPYGKYYEYITWTTEDKKDEDITEIYHSYRADFNDFANALKITQDCQCQFDKQKKVDSCAVSYPLFAGRENTKAAVEQIGNKALAAYAATQFYVGDKTGDFGQGKWYLPSIGEWMVFYGVNRFQFVAPYSAPSGESKTLINSALTTLSDKGVEAEALGSSYYLTSSRYWIIKDGALWNNSSNSATYAVRCSMFVTLSTGGIPPKVGDVMYLDKTYGSVADYDGSKTPVGVVSSVSEDGHEVTIINLKDLTFSSSNTAGNFDPENPYSGSIKTTQRGNVGALNIESLDSDHLYLWTHLSNNRPCQFYPPE